jgi:imidazolonepropionase-like amidohydrolase
MKKGYVQLPYDFAARRDGFLKRSEQFLLYAILIAVVLGTTNFSNFFKSPRSNGRGQNKVAISSVELAAGHARCLLDQQRPVVDYNLASDRLTKLSNNDASRRLILKNAVLIDGDGKARGNGSLVIRDGIIEKILDASEGLSLQPDDQVMDIAYRYVTPGLIEMHSHAGVREIPQMWANEDVTELSSPITPWARAIDAYKSYDVGIDLVAGGGVTTSLVLTGAQSIMSGEGYVFKMKRGDSPYDVLVNTSRDAGGKPQRYMKMALGENIKKTWGNKPGGPTTRQGISFYFRRAMEKARNLLREQDRWCQSLASMNEGDYMSNPYPESLESQNLVDLMRGDFRLNVHCYETQDVYSLFDHSDEFGFKISAIHHALASHLMIDELKKRNVTVATFSDEWGFKMELYDTSYTRLPKAIVDAGIPLVLTTDHPSTYGKLLMYVAQVAYHYGVSSELAIASLIAEPARGLGLDNRLGFLRPGYDADLVVWDKHPLRMGSMPLGVIIDGELIINSTSALWEDRQPLNSDIPPPQAPQGTNGHKSCVPGAKNLIIQGISDDYFNEDNSDMASDGDDSSQAIAVIQDGQLECVGKGHCRELAQRLSAGKHFRVMNVTNGVVTPVSSALDVLWFKLC